MDIGDDGQRRDGRALSYSEYINVPALLSSLALPEEPPRGVKPADWPVRPEGWKPGDVWPRGGQWSHDEVLFITTHQAFEVWFRQVLHELDSVMFDAREIASPQGIPHVDLVSRVAETAPTAGRYLLTAPPSRYPRLAAMASRSATPTMLYDAPAPGVFGPSEESPRPRLADFGACFDRWIDRVSRAEKIITTCIPFFEVLLHMKPGSFLEFRERLIPASGFGSTQFREIEVMLGLRERQLSRFSWGSPATKALYETLSEAERALVPSPETWSYEESFDKHAGDETGRIVRRMEAPTLRDLVYWLLGSEELVGANDALRWQRADKVAARNFERVEAAHSTARGGHTAAGDVWRAMGALLSQSETVNAAEIERAAVGDALTTEPEWAGVPRELLLAFREFLDACLRLDNAVLLWRETHVRFVERVIGARPGTGGGGLRYLRSTVDPGRTAWFLRALPCLWDARTLL